MNAGYKERDKMSQQLISDITKEYMREKLPEFRPGILSRYMLKSLKEAANGFRYSKVW